VEGLPETVQKPLKELETRMMQVLYDFSSEYLENAPACEESRQKDGLKAIDVM